MTDTTQSAEDRTILQLFEQQVAENPDTLAIVFEGDRISYGELNARANQIAHALIRMGLTVNQSVAMTLSDGPGQIAALLGIAKAGGVSVCLDSDHPSSRLGHILEETEPTLLIAESNFADDHIALGEQLRQSRCNVLILDRSKSDVENAQAWHRGFGDRWVGPEVFEACPTANPDVNVKSADPIYIVYTSGSTGRPKGIVQSHRSFLQFIEWQSAHFGIGAPQRFAQWASIAYDAGYRQVLGTLCFGATLCMAPASLRYCPSGLVRWIREEQITILNVVPSFLRQIIDVLKGEGRRHDTRCLPHLEQLLLSGEVLTVQLASEWFDLFEDPPKLFNLYGPSECILATCHQVENVGPEQRSIPIGRPIGGREILILDEAQQPCPTGDPGEICVRSPYLTMGYFQRPEETKSKFIRNPLQDDCPDPVYRTSDLGRVLADGSIEFCGRIDNQVKLRGMRIELEDIESSIRLQEGIRNCAAVVHTVARRPGKLVAKDRGARASGNSPGQQMLVAYYTADCDISNTDLRSSLKDRLPAHMVPQQFIRLDDLPLNANRKLDRKALSRREVLQPERRGRHAAPSTANEALILGVWQDVFGFERIGVSEGFFELGGDSLLAMQVIYRIRQATHATLSLRDLFDNPTIAELARLIERPREAGPPVSVMAEAAARHGRYPLTLPQQGLWFLWRLEPDTPYYTGQGTISLRGRVIPSVLQEAWSALLDRHEILRVRFGTEDNKPNQVFDRPSTGDLPLVDLTGRPESAQWDLIERKAKRRAQHPLNLEEDPLLQAQVFKLAEDEYQILITFHEIILDLWGLSIMARDLGILYEQLERSGETTLRPPKPRFRDYALWESAHLQRHVLKAQRAYWEERLAGELPILSLPMDRPRPASPTYRGAAKSVMLDADLSRQLKALSRQEHATLFMTILTAFNVLLHAYSGQDDLIVGAPIANRTQEGAEDLVGFFLNMLPLRTRFESDPTFLELLQQVQKTVVGAISNADYPFMWMLEGTSVVRDMSTTPVFQVMFNMLNLPHVSPELDGLEVAYNELETGYLKYDLALYAQEHDEQIFLQLAYLTDLFDDETIDRMLKNLVVLLSSVLENPKARVSSLDKLSREERQALLFDFNATDSEFANSLCIHQLFEKQVERTPKQTAFMFGGRNLSYAELNTRSNQLAHYLRRSGVGPETAVAICLERSFEMLIGLLAVMKAGGTYVALDPSYPVLRLRNILEDSNPAILLVEKGTDVFDAFTGKKILVDADQDLIEEERITNPECLTTPKDVLNLVYTSSTTGKPKGVLITIDSVLNRLFWMWEAFPFRPGDVAVLQKSYALVAATWECFGALLKGIPTVILTREDLLDPAELWNRLVTHRVSYLLGSPALLEGVLEQAESHPGEWYAVRLATTSAEPIDPAMVKRWRSAFPRVPLFNLYGSTECSSNVSAYDTRELADDSIRVPVGRPLSNIQVYVLDENLNPCPIGVTGEMCVSGACLARGYLNDSSLSERQFVPHPFSAEPGSRLYKTGDLARYRADGCLELVGRKDQQVKIRGFRVELGDIEATLSAYEAVNKCAVTLHGPRVVAYVVSDEGLSLSSLRRFMRERLPEYMVPVDYVQLDELPLTATGKVHRNGLPAPEQVRLDLEVEYVPPRTALEEELVRMWTEILGVERVGVLDDFFDLGGHSLQAARLASTMSETVDQEIPVRTLFSHRTIHELADVLSGVDISDRAPAMQSTSSKSIHGVVSAEPTFLDDGFRPPPYMEIDRRSLLSLFATGQIPSVDSASIGCMPIELLNGTGFTHDEVIYGWCNNLPTLIAISETSLGRIARLKLPRFNSEIYRSPQELLKTLVQTLELARTIGARVVSLTGLIPSATDYGHSLADLVSAQEDLPPISTGHATTISSVVLAIEGILVEGGRDLETEVVGFLGLGSIGQASLRLMLDRLPHPREILLCDVYSKRDALEKILRELRERLGFRGAIRILESKDVAPCEFYDASLIVGATNVPDILDVSRLNEGTMVVDDSSPHCFTPEAAIRRCQEREDILFTEGGVLRSPDPIRQLSYLPWDVERMMNLAHMAPFAKYDPFQITSCVLSGLLSSRFGELRPTLGIVDLVTSLQNYDRLSALGFEASPLHCGGFTLPDRAIDSFRRRFAATRSGTSLPPKLRKR